MNILKDKVAIVTGAAKGMGKAHALKLAQAGAKVAVCDIDIQGCQAVVDEIKKMGVDALAVKCDVSKKNEIDSVISETLKDFGKIDILVNNAGIYPFKPFLELSEQDFMKVIDINLKGYFLMAQTAAKEMAKTGGGSIINIASVAASKGFAGLAHYCASKGGIVAMSKVMALELAPLKIRVNCIAPGAIDVGSGIEMDEKSRQAMLAPIPMKRQGMPEEISSAVLFLASDESSYMTGSVMVVDGGWTAG